MRSWWCWLQPYWSHWEVVPLGGGLTGLWSHWEVVSLGGGPTGRWSHWEVVSLVPLGGGLTGLTGAVKVSLDHRVQTSASR